MCSNEFDTECEHLESRGTWFAGSGTPSGEVTFCTWSAHLLTQGHQFGYSPQLSGSPPNGLGASLLTSRPAPLRLLRSPSMERRGFLLALAAGLAGVAVGHGLPDPVELHAAPRRTPVPAAAVSTPPPPVTGPAPPPVGVVSGLPAARTDLALTVDDGTSTEVVAAFAKFAKDSGVRLTFFP